MVARTDKVTDPVIQADLLLARRGQAYFSRKLNQLKDAEFDEPSGIEGWSRAQVISHVGYHARGVARMIEGASTGTGEPMFSSTAEYLDMVEYGATLVPFALRNLSDHAAVHLTVEWRDLDEERWSDVVPVRPDSFVPVATTPLLRARETWIRAVDLNNGGSFDHFPDTLVDDILTGVVASWRERDEVSVVLRPSDREADFSSAQRAEDADLVVTGTARHLARWATGRGLPGLVYSNGGSLPEPPLWLQELPE